MKWLGPVLLLLLASVATAQNPTSGPGATALTFGQSTIYTGHTAMSPTNGQAICNNSGVLGGCTSGSGGAPSNPSGSLQYNNNGMFGAVPAESGSGTCGILGYLNGVWQWYWNNVYDVKCLCGATGNGSTDDTTAINTCISEAEAAMINNPVSAPKVKFPWGHYKTGGTYPNYQPVTLQGPALGGANAGITLEGDGPYSSAILASATFPAVFFEPIGYATTGLGTGADAWTAAPLVGSTGSSLNWGTGTPSNRYLKLNDLNQANGANAIGEEAGLINGISSFGYQHYIQFPSSGLTNGHVVYNRKCGSERRQDQRDRVRHAYDDERDPNLLLHDQYVGWFAQRIGD